MELLHKLIAQLKQAKNQSTIQTSVNESILSVLEILLEEGYIKGYTLFPKSKFEQNKSKRPTSAQNTCTVYLKTTNTGKYGLLDTIVGAMSPGKIKYLSHKQIKELVGKYRLVVVSTSHGIITGLQACKLSIGGLVLLHTK